MIINELGQGALLSKIDFKNVFRLIPMQQEDWNLLGMHWKDKYYIDTYLPFGLQSAPFYSISWLMQYIGYWWSLPPFTLFGWFSDFRPSICNRNLSRIMSLCQAIGAPIKTEKVEGPMTCLTFLGIVLKAASTEARISLEQKKSLLATIKSLCNFKKCMKGQLSLIGDKLSFACKVFPAAWFFYAD